MQRIKKCLTYGIAIATLTLAEGAFSPSVSAIPILNRFRPSNPRPVLSNPSQPEDRQVNLFYPNATCDRLVPEPWEAPENNAVEATVGQTIERSLSGDFDVVGYRVNLDETTAIVDLRLSPDSDRHFLSLSQCEKFALFGSLRETLTENSLWNVDNVRFTSQGEDIMF
ncbi:MAG: sporulation/spore germination protein [Spirulinaceae cyanobacterium]